MEYVDRPDGFMGEQSEAARLSVLSADRRSTRRRSRDRSVSLFIFGERP
ncbi:MAG: hypothetical protein ABDH63_05485 [Candidatus Caldarchaeales archaeon]